MMFHKKSLRIFLFILLASIVLKQGVLKPPFALGETISHAESKRQAAQRKYFEGLRQRKLFSIAEAACLRELKRTDISDSQKHALVLELTRTYAHHAATVNYKEAEIFWKQADNVLKDFIQKHPASPRILIIKTEHAILPALKANAQRRLWELVPESDALKKKALQSVDFAIQRLKPFEQQLSQIVRQAPRKETGKEPIRNFQLKFLLLQTRYELGRLYVNRAWLLKDNAVERSASLISASRFLKPQAQGWSDDPLTADALTQLAISYRLGKEMNPLNRLIAGSKGKAWSRTVRPVLIAEKIRLYLESQLPGDAMATLKNWEKENLAAKTSTPKANTTKPPLSRTNLTPQLRAMRVWTLILLHNDTKLKDEPKLAAQLMTHAKKEVQTLKNVYPGYWSQWAERKLSRLTQSAELGVALTSAITAARRLYEDKKYPEASAAYWKASVLASSKNKTEKATELGNFAASIDIAQKNWNDAEQKLNTLIQNFPKQTSGNAAENAAEEIDSHAKTDLLHAYCLGQLASASSLSSSAKQKKLQAYESALNAHRKRYSGASTLGEATWMLALFQDAQEKPLQAIRLYGKIDPKHARFPKAISRVVALTRQQIAISQHSKEQTQEQTEKQKETLVTEGIRLLDQTLKQQQTESPDHFLTVFDLDILIMRADLEWLQKRPNFQLIQSKLNRIASTSRVKLGAKEQSRAVLYQLILSSLKNDQQRVQTLMLQWDAIAVPQKATLLGLYSQAVQNISNEHQHAIQSQKIDLIKRVTQSKAGIKIPPLMQKQLNTQLAKTYLSINRTEKAIALLDGLVANSPNDKTLLRWSATLLAQCGTKTCLDKSILRWRQLESKFKPGTLEWFDVRLTVAETLVKAKRWDDCKKLLQLTQILYPHLSKTPKFSPRLKTLTQAIP